MTSLSALGYETNLILAFNVPPGMVDTVARELSSINRIEYLWFTTGRYDIVAVTFYRNPEEFFEIFPKDINNISVNVRMETILVARTIKSTWSHMIGDLSSIATKRPIIPTELDLAVITALEEFPRASVRELARIHGASTRSVSTSFLKLTSRGVIRVRAVLRPNTYRNNVMGLTLIQVQMPNLHILTSKLQDHPSVKGMTLTFGAFNCVIWTSFESRDQMYHFLNHDLGNMIGVVQYESLTILKVEKSKIRYNELEIGENNNYLTKQ